LAINKRRRWKW